MMAGDDLLEVTSLRVYFGGLHAVDGVDLRVKQNSVVGLIGPNGAGKSTVINAISGFVQPQSGSVRLNGSELLKLKPHERARRGLGRTFQNLELFASMTVLENVIARMESLPAAVAGERRRSLREHRELAMGILENLGLAPVAQRVVSQLSYPERKLVEFARATAANADLILLDEPAAGLSAEERPRLVERIRAYLQNGKFSALIVEHDMEVVRNLCGWVYVMDSGKVVMSGAFDDVMSDANVRRAYLGIE